MYLMHHGREGMHWYIKNGPPYPLDQSNKEYKILKTRKTVALSMGLASPIRTILSILLVKVGISMAKNLLKQEKSVI